MNTTTTTISILSPPFLSFPTTINIPPSLLTPRTLNFPKISFQKPNSPFRRRDFRIFSDDGGDADGGGDGDADGGGAEVDNDEMDEEEVDEGDNKRDYDVEYDDEGVVGGEDGIGLMNSFALSQGWNSEQVVDYRINEDEFHKISLMDCDFFIRRPPDPDNDVYDFREMYVTEPDTDIYAIPRVIAPMPQKYIRCAKSDWGTYNVTEPPIDALRDPMYKSEWEVMKVFLTKHYRNRRLDDPDFVLDFEEIYVIDSKTKSITRAKVLVTVPEGRNRDRKNDFLVIRDNATSFKIIPSEERDDPTTVVHREEWDKDRKDMERHLSKLRDFNVSNWF
ncbi:PLASTID TRANSCRIPTIONALLY ACTIVE protein 6, chloroplastic-like isoform X2 [Rutidosis leptorrhynchoides]|uniref:PLASTID TRANSCRIPTIONALLY ACTIVE protein 6, chloroplastic-like isoform X2 n=1 Tax=Rutidosis leptorrhynchoides TaxID=125765 RepID=UPI003A9A4A1F